MTPAELKAYRELCRRWPECQLPSFDWYSDGSLVLNGQFVPEAARDAILIGHLESLLNKHAPGGWQYLHQPGLGCDCHCYDVMIAEVTPSFGGPDRLPPLLATIEAVLSAQEPCQ